MSDTGGSVSKGVFVFKGKKANARVEDYLKKEEHSGDRKYICNDLWEQINEKIQVLQSDLNTKIFDELVHYVQNAHKDYEPSSCEQQSHKTARLEIPTAALVTGVNMPDHEVMFSNLASLLKEKVTSHIAMLRQKDCPNLKTAMGNMISQLMDNTCMIDEDDESNDNPFNMRRVSCTMTTVKAWYLETSKQVNSPRKKRPPASPRKSPKKSCLKQYSPIVIILEDMEGFADNVLQDFITICSNHIKELPIVLIFGLATSVTAVHRLLPHQVSSMLCMEKFQAPPSSEYLNHIIDEIVMNEQIPFKLSGKSFHLVLDLFLYHDFSVLNFIRGFQFAMVDHYYNNSSSILCQPLSDVEAQLSECSHQQIENIRSNLSYRRFVESQPHREQISLLEDDNYTKKIIYECLAAIDHYHSCFFPIMKSLHTFTGKLPRYPLGKQLREMYATCLSTSICDTPEFGESLSLLRTMSRDEMSELLLQSSKLLDNNCNFEELESISKQLQKYHEMFRDMDITMQQESQEECEESEKEEALPKKMDIATLRKTLQAMEQKKKKPSPYEALRNETIDFLETIFRKYLKCPTVYPLYEIQYYTNVGELRRHVNASPRATIQCGLSNPYYYLQNPELNVSSDMINPSLLDLCIVYKLHLECGRMINLYDWLQAFITVVNSDSVDSSEDYRKPDKSLQARFIKAVSELQFIGFIKPTKRKTDHVARLTWGGC